MATAALQPIPSIQISPAPPEKPVIEPYSPFSSCFSPSVSDDAFRPQHLTPPPSHTSFPKQLSPLRPPESVNPASGQGLARERFERLLQAQRDRNSALGSNKKPVDLRKEIALKAHKNKQVERRALFLSKVLAPPSPTATFTPKTPPESPAIFHYTLPSPGLVSPLALFETLEDLSYGPDCVPEPWVEQVDFRLPAYNKERDEQRAKNPTPSRASFSNGLPSLDQITARLSSQGHGHISLIDHPPSRSARLPAFLANRVPTKTTNKNEHSRLPAGVGRLQMPVRVSQSEKSQVDVFLPPGSPKSLMPKIEITTTVVPRTATTSSISLTESNLQAFDCRERRAQDMLSTLRRRTVPSDQGLGGHEVDERKTKWKRHSAPADLTPLRPRSGFEHPALSFPGGF